MKNSRTALVVAMTGALLLGCQEKASTAESAKEATAPAAAAAVADTSNVVATVNGQAISRAMLDKQVERLQTQPTLASAPADQLRLAAVEAVLHQEIMVQEAVKLGYESRADLMAEIDNKRRNILANSLLKDHLDNLVIDDATLQAAYDEHFASKEQEFKARHILLDDEEAAKAVIAELDKGGDFAALAKEKSTGPTGPDGGDLGWISPAQVVPEFGTALKGMEKGKYSAAPVKTQFGWHVILMEESRDVTPPTFEQVKPQLAELKKREALQDYVKGLKDKAVIVINEKEDEK